MTKQWERKKFIYIDYNCIECNLYIELTKNQWERKTFMTKHYNDYNCIECNQNNCFEHSSIQIWPRTCSSLGLKHWNSYLACLNFSKVNWLLIWVWRRIPPQTQIKTLQFTVCKVQVWVRETKFKPLLVIWQSPWRLFEVTIKTTKPMGLLFGLLYSIALAALCSKHKRQLLAKHKHNCHLVAVAAGSNQFAFGKRDATFSTFSRGENVVSPRDTNTIYVFYIAAML